MSEQPIDSKQITKKQLMDALTVAGSIAAGGGIELISHMPEAALIGAVAAFAAGKLGPELAKMFIPGSDPDATSAATNAIIDKLAPAPQDDNRPQDALSKLKRLARIKTAPEESKPKDDRLSITPQAESQAATDTLLPPIFMLDSALETVEAANTSWRLYFGESQAGPVSISIDEMYHVIDASSSGKGKSNRFRLAMMQLVNTCEVYYINPLAAPVKAVKDSRRVEVWAPIFDRLANGKPAKTKEEIEDMMNALVELIEERSEQEQSGVFSWQDQPVFVFIDELPEVFALSSEAIKKLDKVGRMGRQFGVFAYVASQTAQVSEIGQSTAAQANYKTRLYGGGDATSSTRLMKQKVSPEAETILQSETGLTLMLAPGLAGLQFVRAPLVTNEALFAYFGLTFNLADWLPTRGAATSSRRGHALNLSNTTTSSTDRPRRRIDTADEQTNEQKPAMTIDTLTQLLSQDKIDLDTFKRLLDKIEVTDAEVSRPAQDTEPASLRIVPQTPQVDEELERAIEAYQNGAKTLDAMAATFGDKSNSRARLLMPRVKKALGIGA